jgi:hypothetical protein
MKKLCVTFDGFFQISKEGNFMKVFLSVLFLILVFTFTARAQGAYSDGKAAQLSETQKNELLALKSPIAVPTYIPAGFVLKGISAQKSQEGNFTLIDYNLEYIDTKGNTFTIDSTNDGIGDHFIYKTVTGKNPYFKGTLMVGPLDPSSQETNGKEIAGEWIESLPKYNPKGVRSSVKQFYGLSATGITKQEGLKIMLSLRYLK